MRYMLTHAHALMQTFTYQDSSQTVLSTQHLSLRLFCMLLSLSGRGVTPVGQVSVTWRILRISADTQGNLTPSSLHVTIERDNKLMNILALHQQMRERV